MECCPQPNIWVDQTQHQHLQATTLHSSKLSPLYRLSSVFVSFYSRTCREIVCACECAKLLQSCPTLCDPVSCSPPGSSVRPGILQARILEWLAMPSSRGSSQPRDWTQSLLSLAFAGSATWEARREIINPILQERKSRLSQGKGIGPSLHS